LPAEPVEAGASGEDVGDDMPRDQDEGEDLPDFSTPEAVHAYFDTDGNGKIMRGEFGKKLRKLCKGERRCFVEGMAKFRDANKEGWGVTLDEVVAEFNNPTKRPEFDHLPRIEDVDQIMAHFDTDGSNTIEWDEMNQGLAELCNNNSYCMEEGMYDLQAVQQTWGDGI